ncbi:MAG: DegT/DnrJ/EryC1/StrS family aminotransferase [Candidatus Atabeyarchaeum deiterrae]
MNAEHRRLKLIEPVVGKEELQMIQKVLESGWLTEGKVTEEFEASVRKFTGAKYAVATTSCTTALEISLRALQIGPGNEVIVPDFTHPATADVVRLVGAEPVLVDVEPHSYNIDMKEVKKAITNKTKCIIPVSWGGNPLNCELLDEVKREYGLSIVEDAACGLGAEYGGKKTGTMADITCFSFHPRKLVTTGEGGMITTDNEELATEIRSLKTFGMRTTKESKSFERIGTNYKLSDVLAAIGVAQMRKIDKIIARRIELANEYTRLLAKTDFMRPPMKDKNAKHVYQTYAAYLEIDGIRDRIIADLNKQNVETQIGTYALHLQPAFRNARKIGNLEIADKLYRNLIALPMFHSMKAKDQEFVISKIEEMKDAYKR